MATGDLYGDGAKDENGGVEPEDWRNYCGEPLINVLVVSVVAAAGLRDKEGADDGDEEHEVAGESEEDSEAGAAKILARASTALGAIIPVVVVAATAGALVCRRTPTVTAIVIFNAALLFAFSIKRRDGRWHGDRFHRKRCGQLTPVLTLRAARSLFCFPIGGQKCLLRGWRDRYTECDGR